MYERLQRRLRAMAASEHFITNASDKAAIGEAADRIERLSTVLAHRTAQLDRLTQQIRPGADRRVQRSRAMRDITDAEIEAAAIVLYEHGWQGLRAWKQDVHNRSRYRDKARLVLEAARSHESPERES